MTHLPEPYDTIASLIASLAVVAIIFMACVVLV